MLSGRYPSLELNVAEKMYLNLAVRTFTSERHEEKNHIYKT